MKSSLQQLLALLWKEWHEARWFAWAGFLVLIVWPAFQTGSRYARWAGAWPRANHLLVHPDFADFVSVLGAAFVALVAIGVAARDTRQGIAAPWRQTPIRPLAFMAVKFLVGLVIAMGVVLSALALHLIVAFHVGYSVDLLGAHRDDFAIRGALQELTSHVFLLMAVYAICFAITAWLRPVLSAVLVCAIAVGLLYFLPLLWPALSFLNIFELTSQPPMWVFATAKGVQRFAGAGAPVPLLGYFFVFPRMLPTYVLSMIALTGLAAAAGLGVAARGGQMELNTQRVGWVLGVVFLGLFSIATLQVGNNLEPSVIRPLPDDHSGALQAVEIHAQGDELLLGVAVYDDSRMLGASEVSLYRANLNEQASLSRSLRSTRLVTVNHGANFDRHLTWSAQRPDLVFYIDQRVERVNEMKSRLVGLDLVAIDLSPNAKTMELTRMNLFPWFEAYRNSSLPVVRSLLRGDRLFIAGLNEGRTLLRQFDVSDPATPRLLNQWELDQQLQRNFWGMSGGSTGIRATHRLPAVPGFDAQQRFDLWWNLADVWRPTLVQGDCLVTWDRDTGLAVFQRTQTGETLWEYEQVGQRLSTPLEAYLQGDIVDAVMSDGLVFLLQRRSRQDSLVVFDVRDPRQPRKLGHYYAPGEHLRCLVATGDGRVIAGGYALHVFDAKALARR
jgi:hypothetical protein